MKYQVIGTRPIRHDGTDKVTGRALYGADFTMAGLLHGRVLRSPHAHGVIRGIKFSKALQMPGVEAVITSADLADPGDRIADLGEGAIKLHVMAATVSRCCRAARRRQSHGQRRGDAGDRGDGDNLRPDRFEDHANLRSDVRPDRPGHPTFPTLHTGPAQDHESLWFNSASGHHGFT